MPNLSLGTIEVLGLPAAVEAADVACKTADVTLIGYETTDGMGMVAVKIEGQVSAVKSAVAAAAAAAGRVTKVFATSVIARPSDQLEPVVLTTETVGLRKAEPVPLPEPVQPAPEPDPVLATEPATEPVQPTPEPQPAPAGEPAPEAVPAEEAGQQLTPTQVEPTEPAAPAVGPVSLKPQASRRSPMKPRSAKEE
ncbi:MAG TPA: BMC domain-containing protein [Propionibacteriaceae bacterium]|nr:BMC domain-containing protein [Propionibacteriaceae bacterium]